MEESLVKNGIQYCYLEPPKKRCRICNILSGYFFESPYRGICYIDQMKNGPFVFCLMKVELPVKRPALVAAIGQQNIQPVDFKVESCRLHRANYRSVYSRRHLEEVDRGRFGRVDVDGCQG